MNSGKNGFVTHFCPFFTPSHLHNTKTRQHSSRIRTAACQLYMFWWPLLEVIPQVNKFVQVSNDDTHDVSSREGCRGRYPGGRYRYPSPIWTLPRQPEQNDRHLWKHYLPATSFASLTNPSLWHLRTHLVVTEAILWHLRTHLVVAEVITSVAQRRV